MLNRPQQSIQKKFSIVQEIVEHINKHTSRQTNKQTGKTDKHKIMQIDYVNVQVKLF